MTRLVAAQQRPEIMIPIFVIAAIIAMCHAFGMIKDLGEMIKATIKIRRK